MSGCGLAIFVKTPSFSAVKTRLWPHIGQQRAEAFHLAAARAVASVARSAQSEAGLNTYWAVAEAEAMDSGAWPDLHALAQGGDGLGERMHRVYAQLRERHPAALLIGADTPQITTMHLLRAARWLDASEPRLVLGRARDGGFWLFGGNVALPGSAWTNVAYSKPDTATRFARAMSPHGRFLELETLVDVDEYADIAAVIESLEALADPTPAQRRLAAWMNEAIRREGVCP